jgi:argininosuccinate lyase
LPAVAGALEGIAVHADRLREAIDPSMLATDLADHLVLRGIPFREAHAAAGRAVRLAAEKKTALDRLAPADWKSLGIDADVGPVFDPRRSVERRAAIGGTAPEAVRRQLEEARRRLASAPI